MGLRRIIMAAPVSLLCIIVMTLCLGCATQTAQLRNVQPVNDAPTYRRVIDLGTKAAQAMNAPSAGFRYGLIDTQGMNAMVDSKNKTIYVTKGLTSQFSDKELLCVLAHEWAHVINGHYGERIQRAEVIDALSALVSVVNPVGMIASALINPVVKKSFTRAQEEEADTQAAKALNDRMKISPYACVSAFLKLRAYVDRTGGREQGGLLDSHPSLEARIARLKQMWPDEPKLYAVSVISISSAEEAENVMRRLRAGESFGDVASSVSTGVLANINRGEMGRFEEWELGDELADGARKRGGQGVVTVRTAGGYHVVKVEEIRQKAVSGKVNSPAGSRAD